ncbi:hypothetical protein AYO20_01472 [Fonsecaea nubica]|uniref:Uncharacterized protein n=1 Tax=Fonsecaea nubica TaxID=856822 RepID=A0A178DCV8_9EURO|nr:hypothetical protein AYO20_01472 [Fonsecaea nubica]OAL39154.1 hypothetical protein AYO20_01472 [Fonsecaea nubica]
MSFHEAEDDENGPMLFEAPLFVSGDDDDTFHVKNQSLTEWQRRIVMERLTKACTIQCFLVSVLHGNLNKTPESPSATLMVFKFRLDPLKHDRRLIRARIDIEFFAEDREDAAPTVLAVGLDDRWTIGPTADHEDVVKGGNVNFGVAGIPFVNVGVEASLSKTGGRDIHDATTITGGTHFGEGIDAGAHTACGWTLLENQRRKTGVPYSFTVPVLLERHHDKKFKACVHLAAKGNTRTTIEWMFNKVPVDDPVLFNPAVDRRGDMTEAKYTKDELGKWEHEMEQLTHVICRTVYRGAEREI